MAFLHPHNPPTTPSILLPLVPAQATPRGNNVYTKQLPNMCSQSFQSRKEGESRLLTLNLQNPPRHTHTHTHTHTGDSHRPFFSAVPHISGFPSSPRPLTLPLPASLLSSLCCYCSLGLPTLTHPWILQLLSHPSEPKLPSWRKTVNFVTPPDLVGIWSNTHGSGECLGPEDSESLNSNHPLLSGSWQISRGAPPPHFTVAGRWLL